MLIKIHESVTNYMTSSKKVSEKLYDALNEIADSYSKGYHIVYAHPDVLDVLVDCVKLTKDTIEVFETLYDNNQDILSIKNQVNKEIIIYYSNVENKDNTKRNIYIPIDKLPNLKTRYFVTQAEYKSKYLYKMLINGNLKCDSEYSLDFNFEFKGLSFAKNNLYEPDNNDIVFYILDPENDYLLKNYSTDYSICKQKCLNSNYKSSKIFYELGTKAIENLITAEEYNKCNLDEIEKELVNQYSRVLSMGILKDILYFDIKSNCHTLFRKYTKENPFSIIDFKKYPDCIVKEIMKIKRELITWGCCVSIYNKGFVS